MWDFMPPVVTGKFGEDPIKNAITILQSIKRMWGNFSALKGE